MNLTTINKFPALEEEKEEGVKKKFDDVIGLNSREVSLVQNQKNYPKEGETTREWMTRAFAK